MRDIAEQINAVHRETGRRAMPTGDGRTVVLRRGYGAPVADVWEAITDRERIVRWFPPVSGELRQGGTYQIEGNARGEILRCEPPRLLKLTWVYGENPTEADVSVVEVRLSPDDDGHRTVLELEHATAADEHWATYGPGATGVGWDMALFGLGCYLRGEAIGDPQARQRSPEAAQIATLSSRAWGAAHRAAGATAAEAATAAGKTERFYVPRSAPEGVTP